MGAFCRAARPWHRAAGAGRGAGGAFCAGGGDAGRSADYADFTDAGEEKMKPTNGGGSSAVAADSVAPSGAEGIGGNRHPGLTPLG